MDPTQRFSSRVENYVKYRPGYPPAVLDWLRRECRLTSDAVIADIGSGTGILTRLFLENGNRVFGVEPNADMRQAGEQLLGAYVGFTSVDGRSEATTLPDASVDFITAGQAFHWFDPQPTLAEFRRILRPGGWVALVWNERREDTTPFLVGYERLLRTYSTDYTQVRHNRFDEVTLQDLFGPSLQLQTFENHQTFDFEGLKGRLLSSSYVPEAGHPDHEPMLRELEFLFREHQHHGTVRFEYVTEVYATRLDS